MPHHELVVPRLFACAIGVVLTGLSLDARADGPYVGLEGGLNLSHDQTFVDNGKPIGTTEFEDGWIGGVGIGYGFPIGLRPELELAFRHNTVDGYEPSKKDATGSQHAETAILGLWYDLPFARVVHPSIGVGAGQAHIRYNHFSNAHNVDRSDSDQVFAWQAGAGLRFDISPRFSLSLGYRYLETKKASYRLDPVDAPYVSDAILAGVRMSFKRVPQVAAAEPAPLPQTEVASFETIVLRPVNFRFDKSDLTAPAQATLDEIAAELAQHPELHVVIEGHCDFIGTDEYNDALGMRRATSVHDYLVAHGVAEDQLELKSYGEAQPVADNHTRDGRAANRRASFRASQAPGNLQVITEDPTEETWRAAHGPEDPMADPPGTPPEGSQPPK